MNSDPQQDSAPLNDLSQAALIDRVCDEFEAACRRGDRPRIDDLLGSVAEPLRARLFQELVLSELEFQAAGNATIDLPGLLARFPGRAHEIRRAVAEFRRAKSPRPGVAEQISSTVGPLAVDTLVGHECGNYRLLREVARGGMGIVFEAYDRKLQRAVALKMILDRNLASEEAVRRFHAEAETAASLNHPGIVPVYDVGSHAGHHYYAMRFVAGPTLSDELRRRRFSMEEAARLVLQLAHAVAYAHQHGVVHRDLKPGNVLLSPEGQPQITDFGLARRTDRPSQLTIQGQILGTPGYMAPEQAAGDVEQMGPAVDIYALGAILYHLTTGHPPFRTSFDALVCVLEQDPLPPRSLNRQVPRDLNLICMKCLSKNPADRYASVQELVGDLQNYLMGELIQARPASVRRRLQRWARHRPRLASVLLTMVAFYIHHLVSYAMGNPDSRGWFHWQATGTVLLVCGYAGCFQSLLMRPGARRSVLHAWVGTDIVVFTLFLLLAADGPHSPLVAIYFGMVASAALAFDRYMVWWVTGACMASYVFLVHACAWYRPELGLKEYRETMPVVICMLAIGVVQYYVLRCARLGLSAAENQGP